jgi:L-2,4-diaminobutyrate decarboxylase
MTLLPDLDETRVDQETDAGYPAGRTTAGSRPPVNASPDLDFGAGVELALAASNHLFNARNAPRYVAQVLQGVNAVATKIERTSQPRSTPGSGKTRSP